MEPAPKRSRKTTGKEFLRRDWESIVAADFFTVEVWTRRGLQRLVLGTKKHQIVRCISQITTSNRQMADGKRLEDYLSTSRERDQGWPLVLRS
jgi:hypothetical protein